MKGKDNIITRVADRQETNDLHENVVNGTTVCSKEHSRYEDFVNRLSVNTGKKTETKGVRKWVAVKDQITESVHDTQKLK